MILFNFHNNYNSGIDSSPPMNSAVNALFNFPTFDRFYHSNTHSSKLLNNHNTKTTFRYIFAFATILTTKLFLQAFLTLIYTLPTVNAIVNTVTKSSRERENPEKVATAPDLDISTTFT